MPSMWLSDTQSKAIHPKAEQPSPRVRRLRQLLSTEMLTTGCDRDRGGFLLWRYVYDPVQLMSGTRGPDVLQGGFS